MTGYKILTPENQRDLLKDRVRQYETSHFQFVCEREIAKVQGRTTDAEIVQSDIEPLEAALDWCHNLFDALHVALEVG